MNEDEIVRLEEQLAEARARRFMAERDAAASLRQAGLAKEPKKLAKATARVEARVIQWREKETELEAKIEALRKEGVPAVTAETTESESAETSTGEDLESASQGESL